MNLYEYDVKLGFGGIGSCFAAAHHVFVPAQPYRVGSDGGRIGKR
jgi:hypothetical protein